MMLSLRILFFKLSIIALIFIVYIFAVRPIRSSINFAVSNSLEPSISKVEDLKLIKRNTQIWIYQYQNEMRTIFTFKFPFGFFFLLGLIGLLIFSAKKEYYYLLVSVHFLAIILSLICIYLGLKSPKFLYSIMDFISRYFLPLASLGIVALQLQDRKDSRHAH